MEESKQFERLPTDVKPTLYNLFIKPDLINFKFDGKEVISLKILESTTRIVLNCVEINISSAKLKLSNGETVSPQISLSGENETLTLTFSASLPVGDAELTIEFVGVLNDKTKGFYRCKQIQVADQEDKYVAVTHFEPTDARQCFPCWDEPAVKARFDITLAVEADKVAISNMPVLSETVNEGVKTVKFQTTPVMSTYLIALAVGNFDHVEGSTSDGILVRIYTPPGKKEQGRFSLHLVTKLLPYYKEYFRVEYPLPKIDLIAVPENPIGAMENWGLLTFREQYLLVDEANSSATTKQNVALVVGHECAHMWFGNLVTMEWWTHLWLKEGYATFIQFLCVEYLFPEYDIWSQFVTDDYCSALKLDALKSSHPIEVSVDHPSEIDQIFDDISYSKGASVIRMLHKYIGDDDFRKGMNLYLTRHQYGNTRTEDLWETLEEASRKPIKTIMPTWTKQKGFPVIAIESSTQEDNNVRTLVVSQTRFSAGKDQEDNESVWLVPLTFCKSSKPNETCFSALLEGKEGKISIPNIQPNEWIKLNPECTGFYRTKYTPELFQQLLPSVAQKTLPPLDRLGLLDDLFALVRAGQASTVQTLELMQAMREEDNYTVWSTIDACLEKLCNLFMNTDLAPLYNRYGLSLMKSIARKLGYEIKSGESGFTEMAEHLDTLLKSLVFNRLVKFGDKEFSEIARKEFEEHCSGKKSIPADLRSEVYKAVIAVDGKLAMDSLLKLYQNTDLLEEKNRILRSFIAVTDITVVEEVLKFTESNNVNPNSAGIAIMSVASSKVGRDLAWQFLQENWDKLYHKYAGRFQLPHIVKCTTSNFVTEEKAKEVESFFSNKDLSGLDRILVQSLETIRNNAAWLERDRDSIKSYLEKL